MADRSRGRPTKFKPEYIEKARLLASKGLIDVEIAEFFDVELNTFRVWRAKYPELNASLKAGKVDADDRVERSLYERACGYSMPAVKIFMPANATAPIYAPYVEHTPPDTVACIFWLKNRRKEEWRQVIDPTQPTQQSSQPKSSEDPRIVEQFEAIRRAGKLITLQGGKSDKRG